MPIRQFNRLYFALSAVLMAVLAVLTAVVPEARAEGPPVPEPGELMNLVRSTVLAADQGNKSGDYSALANLGSSTFQANNSASELKSRFSKLRASGVDLAAAATLVPQTTRPPTLDQNGLLRILGYFEFPDRQIVYDLLYAYDLPANAWRLAGISIEPRRLPAQPELMQPQ